jgi:poly(beta-D-mannuronate) lyase
MSTNKLLSTLALFFMSTLGYAQVVNNATELNSAINSASPGTTIILADGTWNNVFVNIDKNGTSSQPITITAQNPGAVLMTGNSRVYMEGAYLTVSGLVFQDPANLVVSGGNIEPVIELKQCNNCKIINNKIDTYNGTESQKALKFKWILNDGQYNEIAYNSFIGKYGVGSIINDNRNSSAPDYLKIHHNYFADRTPINEVNEDNDQDAIRIGNSSTSLDNSFSEVYQNYFYNFVGEVEVISNKSGQNKYYNNTFRGYSGTLTLRHGNNCEVYGNYFFAEDNIFSGGIRVIGEDHKIFNNYIEGVNSTKPDGSTSNATGGINVSNGRLNSAINGYYQVKNTQVINNTFVNCDYALRIGTKVSSDLDQAPENLIVANNLMYNSSVDDYQIVTTPSGTSVSEGNITGLPGNDMADDGNFHRLTSGSSPIDAGIGNYSFLTQDILGGDRDANFDAGAEEFGANGTNLPYNEFDVGVNLGFGATSSSIATSPSTINFGVCGATLTFEVIANVDWEITENLSWLSLDVTSGSGTTTITATTTENTTGAERSGNISINEAAGGNDLSAELSIVQLITSITFEIPIAGTTSLGMQDEPDIAEINAYNDDLTDYWTGNPDTEPEVSITFDLGELYFLSEIGINFWKADQRTTTFSIAIADEASGPFTTVLDNEISAESGVSVDTEQLFFLNDMVGRYVKFIGIGNSSSTNWTSIANVNIYGDLNCENAATGVFNNKQEDPGISLFPVPVTDGILNILSTYKVISIIEVYNVAGQRVLTTDGNGLYSKQIDVSKLNTGIYFLNLEEIGLAKFIIK